MEQVAVRSKLKDILKALEKEKESMSKNSKNENLAEQIGGGTGKAVGMVVWASLRVSVEAAKVFVLIWLLTYFEFLPL